MKAVIIQAAGNAVVAEVQEPRLRPEHYKVKTVAIGLNPTDVHHTDMFGRQGGIIGCDYSGVVKEVGDNCREDIKKGDRIIGVAHGANMSEPEDGAFGEYVAQKCGLCAKMPENMTFEDAASLGVAITSNAQLYESLGLPLPDAPTKKTFPILIYGGSTSHGSLAIQYAKLSGLTVITTASPSNFDFVKGRGAEAVFDYHDPECGEKIRAHTDGKLHYAYDAIGLPETAAICAKALAPHADEGKTLRFTGSLPIESFPRDDVVKDDILAYTSIGEAFEKFGMQIPAFPEKYDFATKFWALSSRLLNEGKLVPHPVEVREGGLGGVPSGLQDLRENKVRGKKLVYRVAETPEHLP